MIPICLVTGFLGSGKTTFLRHLVERLAQRRIIYLVNELSEVDVDGALLGEVEDDVVAIAGGSIFCRCLASEFIAQLSTLPERFGNFDGAVIEASGIADPRVMQQLLVETGLEQVYALSSIVTVVDPGTFPRLLHTLDKVRAQVEAADVVLINKIDQYSARQVEEAEGLVRQIKPGVRVVRTEHCRAELELFGPAPARALAGEYAPCRDPNYGTLTAQFPGPVDLGRLMAALAGLRGEIYRAKGFVPATDGIYYLDLSPAGLTTQRMNRSDLTPELAIITRGEDCPGAERLVAALTAGELAACSQSRS